MNPSLSRRVVDRAFEEDPEAASAEYGGEFRGDIAVFVSRDAIDACVTAGVTVRPPIDGVSYFGFVDPSGGSSDSMTLAIAHNERERVVIDCVGERKAPFSPDSVVSEFPATLESYRISMVVGGSICRRMSARAVQGSRRDVSARGDEPVGTLPRLSSACELGPPRLARQRSHGGAVSWA
jgi:hypothetical protein